MNVAFYVSAAVAIIATFMVVSSRSAMHALLYLIVSFLAVAIIFFALGAYFVAALEVIVYAGAIMVLFIFVIMMLNPGGEGEAAGTPFKPWHVLGPSILGLILLVELVYTILTASGATLQDAGVSPKAVGIALFGPYVIGVEIASLLLLSALVGVYHLGRRPRPDAGTGGER